MQDHECQKMKLKKDTTVEKRLKTIRTNKINKKIDKLDVLKSEINYLIETIERINDRSGVNL